MDEFNLKEEMKELKNMINKADEQPKKKKEFKMPFKGKLTTKNLSDNYVTYLLIKENKDVEFRKEKIDEGTIMIDKTPRVATAEYILSYKGKPLIIQPEWSIEPFSVAESRDEATLEKKRSAGYALLLNRMQKEAIQLKKKMSAWLIIIIIAVIGVAGFILLGGGKYLGFK